MITRKAKIKATWTCEDKKGSLFKMHYVNVNIVQTYIKKKPIEPFNEEGLNRWLDERSYTVIKKMCERSCESLCDSCYCTESSIDFDIIEVPTQTGEIVEIKVPQDVLDRIERLEELIADSMKAIEEYEDQIADILAKKEEERTTEDREKLIRLDGYVRSERESIRKYQFGIDRLKKEWNIE